MTEANSSPADVAPRVGPGWQGLAGLAVLVAVMVALLHVAGGSGSSELGSHPDEAAHFVTGLMVRDYVAAGCHGSPLRYADEYYRHYPKIGLGVWPPFFYVVQAVWTLILPPGPVTVLWLMGTLGMALGVVMGWWLWRAYGWAEGVTGAVLLTGLPLVQMYSNMVMAEVLSGLLMLGAAVVLAQFMEDGEWGGAVAFGVYAGLAIMTKGTGLALVLVPGLAIAFTGRWGMLRSGRLWSSALIVAVLAGPWTWHFRNQGRGGWEEPSPSIGFTVRAIVFYGRQLAVAGGWFLLLPAMAGALTLLTAAGRKVTGTAVCVSLVLGIWAFQAITPVGLEARHLLPAMPALVWLAITGVRWMAGKRRGIAVWAVVLLIFFAGELLNGRGAGAKPGYGSLGDQVAISPFRIPKKEWHGWEAVAREAIAGGRRHVLVASDSRGEGMFIADVAMVDPHRPSYVVDRASKLLAASTWSGSGYQSFYTDPAEVTAGIKRAGIEAVVVDTSPAVVPPHEALLIKTMASETPAGRLPATRDGRVYADALGLFYLGGGH